LFAKVSKKGIQITKFSGQDLPKENIEQCTLRVWLVMDFLLAADYDGGFEIESIKK